MVLKMNETSDIGKIKKEPMSDFFDQVEFEEKVLKVGFHNLKFTVLHKKSQKPVKKKLELEVIPWMPTSAQHDITELPTVQQLGNGKYLIERLNFSSEGAWEVHVRIDQNRKEDSVVIDVDVVK